MARPNTQAERRADILAATATVLERTDPSRIRLQDVAEELRLTPNAIRYYFKDIDSLITELALQSDVRFHHDRLARIAELDDFCQQLAATIAAGLPTGADDVEWRAIWRAVLSAGFSLDRHPQIQGIYHRQVELYTDLLTGGAEAGAFRLALDARDIARTLMSLEDYIGYRIVAQDPQLDRATGLRLMVQYAQLATGATLPAVD